MNPILTPSPAECLRIKASAEAKLREADRAEGSLAEWRRRLKKEHGCATAADGHALLKKLRARQKKLAEEVRAAAEDLMDEHGEKLQ